MSATPQDLIEKLESDRLLTNATDDARSKVVMGVTKLVEQEPEEAVEYFESGLSEEHTVPALWLGKAYAEALISSPEREYAKFIHRSASQAFDHCTDPKAVVEQYAGILSVALSRSSTAIDQSIETAERTGQKAAAEKNKAFWSAVGAAVSAGAALASDSDIAQGAGAAGAVGAGAKSANHADKAAELQDLKDDMYGVALGHVFYTVPFARIAVKVEEVVSPSTSDLLGKEIARWEKSVATLINKKVEIGVKSLKENTDTIINNAIDYGNYNKILSCGGKDIILANNVKTLIQGKKDDDIDVPNTVKDIGKIIRYKQHSKIGTRKQTWKLGCFPWIFLFTVLIIVNISGLGDEPIDSVYGYLFLIWYVSIPLSLWAYLGYTKHKYRELKKEIESKIDTLLNIKIIRNSLKIKEGKIKGENVLQKLGG